MSKYKYESSFEDAIKNGISKEEYSRVSSTNCILSWIANELAESNRLKRIEIRLNMNYDRFHDIQLKEELEDQA